MLADQLCTGLDLMARHQEAVLLSSGGQSSELWDLAFGQAAAAVEQHSALLQTCCSASIWRQTCENDLHCLPQPVQLPFHSDRRSCATPGARCAGSSRSCAAAPAAAALAPRRPPGRRSPPRRCCRTATRSCRRVQPLRSVSFPSGRSLAPCLHDTVLNEETMASRARCDVHERL